MRASTATEEHGFFFGNPTTPMFGVLHRAAELPGQEAAGIVICSPIAHEHEFSHRMLVEWARTLSRLGAWVLRFDYRGHGDSAGAFRDCVFEDFVHDTAVAIAELESRTGAPCRGLCGLRLGATLAAVTAARDDRKRFPILWEPIVSGRHYLDELLRSILVKDMALKTKSRTTRSDLKQQMDSGRPVVVEGREITAEFSRSLENINLLDVCPTIAAPTLIVQISKRLAAAPRNDLEALRNAADARFHRDLRMIEAPPLWFGSLIQHYADRVYPRSLFEETVAWLRTRIGGFGTGNRALPNGRCMPPAEDDSNISVEPPETTIGATATSRESCLSESGSHERAVSFPVDGLRCAGVLHVPGDYDPRRPVVLMLPQGMNLRTGWNRLHVKLARHLGAQGWVSLRFDTRGLGNSEGTLDMPTGADLFHAIETGMHLKDTSDAIRFVQRVLGAQAVVLLGVCGGAVTAGLAAGEDARVAGIALLELPITYSRHPKERQAQPMWRYRKKVLSLAAWQRVLRLQIDYKVHLRSLWRVLSGRAFLKTRMGTERDWLLARLGPSANMALISAIERCCNRGIPILCVFGSTDNAQNYDRVRSSTFLRAAAAGGRLSEYVIDGADHDFLLPQHSQELADRLQEWLASSFLSS